MSIRGLGSPSGQGGASVFLNIPSGTNSHLNTLGNAVQDLSKVRSQPWFRSVLTEHSQGNPERFEPVGAQQCSQLQADEIFATSISERIELGAVYPQDWFFKITTISHEEWRMSLPKEGWGQWRHKLFLLPKICGEADGEMLIYRQCCRLFLLLFMLIPCTLYHTQCSLAYKAHQQALKSRHSLWAPGPLLHRPHIPKQPTAR